METEVQAVALHSAVWWVIVGSAFAIFAVMQVLLRSAWVRAKVLTTNFRKQLCVALLALAPAIATYVESKVPAVAFPVWLTLIFSSMGWKGGWKGLGEDVVNRRAAIEEDLALKAQTAAKTDPPAGGAP